MIKTRILFLIHFLFTIITVAQNTVAKLEALPQENIYVHYTTNLVLTGEKLYYKIYTLTTDDKLSTLSKIAYIEIIDATNKSLFKQKLNLENGVASSDLFIPTTVKTGSYKLIAYTQWMLNKQHFFEDTIYIVNPFQTPEKTKTIEVSDTKKTNSNTPTLTPENKYSKREKVALDLSKENLTGNLSVSVRKINPANFPSKKQTQIRSQNSTSINGITINYLPELRGDLIHGTLTAKNTTTSVYGKKVGLSTIEETPFTLFATTNRNGDFYFNLKNNDTATLFFQVLENDSENYSITITNDHLFDSKLNDFPEMPFSKNISDVIKERSLYLQIENSYSSVKQDQKIAHKNEKHVFHKKTITYVLNDFKRFKTLKEVATEILDDVWYTQRKDQFSLHVRDTNLETDSAISTLVLIDGYIVYNHNEIKGYNALQIEKVDIVKEKYVYGGVLYQGILNIKTFKNDYIPNAKFVKEVTILKPELLKKYFYQDHAIEKETKRIPDYRTQLLWQPNVSSNTKEITFYTSDVTGDFEIEILRISSEGKPIVTHRYFTVE